MCVCGVYIPSLSHSDYTLCAQPGQCSEKRLKKNQGFEWGLNKPVSEVTVKYPLIVYPRFGLAGVWVRSLPPVKPEQYAKQTEHALTCVLRDRDSSFLRGSLRADHSSVRNSLAHHEFLMWQPNRSAAVRLCSLLYFYLVTLLLPITLFVLPAENRYKLTDLQMVTSSFRASLLDRWGTPVLKKPTAAARRAEPLK